jgi:hypothetical protein
VSYDVSIDQNRRRGQAWRDAEALEDLKRFRFLEQLDRAQFEVTDWEATFIESQLQRAVQGEGFTKITFSAKQRESIDKMMTNYGSRL